VNEPQKEKGVLITGMGDLSDEDWYIINIVRIAFF
jgi:hypothetical protein